MAKEPEKSLHAGHRSRLKNQFLKNGLDSMEDHVVLELLLFYSMAQVDTNPIAHRLLAKFGSLAQVFDAPYEQLLTVEGVGPAAATLIKLVPQLSRRYNESRTIKKNRIYSLDQIVSLLETKFIGAQEEQIVLVLLGSDGSLLFLDKVCEGSVGTVPVYVRRIIRLALQYDADTALIAHNHPSGNALPSSQDIAATRELYAALEGVNIHFEDHLIFAAGEYVSLRRAGWLDKIRKQTAQANDATIYEVANFLEEQKKARKTAIHGTFAANSKPKKR